MDPSTELWNHLRRVSFLRFVAQSQSDTGWSGSALGTVVVASPSNDVLVFTESGNWQPIRGRQTRFSNVFRWTMLGPDSIRLEHLRFGIDYPVYLFDLGLAAEETWIPVSPHLCQKDCYSASLRLHEKGVDMSWSITGPKKSGIHSI